MIKVIYWSGTGNTKKMAELIAQGITEKGQELDIKEVGDVTEEDVTGADILLLGCPSMGAEELEDYEMEPFVEGLSDKVSRKKVSLFGSYGWGSGEWMDIWKERMEGYGADVVLEPIIVNEMPEGEEEERCIQFGRDLADK